MDSFFNEADAVRTLYDAAWDSYVEAVRLRQAACFGEAVNAFAAAAETAARALSGSAGQAQEDTIKALQEIRSRALASIGLIREINGFVNTDLMNP